LTYLAIYDHKWGILANQEVIEHYILDNIQPCSYPSAMLMQYIVIVQLKYLNIKKIQKKPYYKDLGV